MPEMYGHFSILDNISETQDPFSYGCDLQTLNIQGIYSPLSESQGTGSANSPMSCIMSPLQGNEFLSLNDATVIGEPHITILEEPMEKFRFRYKSEMVGTHGSLVGSNSNSRRNKNAPSVHLHNFLDSAIIRCTLVTSDESHRIPHAHRLVYRDGGVDYDDPHHIKVSPETGYIATFHGMTIIHTARKYVRDELIKKMKREALEKKQRSNKKATLSTREEAQIKADAENYQKCVNLNSVALCFQAFIMDEHEIMTPITEPVYSHAINNLKCALTGELKICRIDKHTSSVEGGEEVFILVEKVGKKNIKIKFFELNDDDCEIWCAYGRFSELDVHHQYAIVFRTPPYKDLDITSPREVFVKLERPSDGDYSEPIKFTYKPSDRMIGRKRQRMSYSGSTELSCAITASACANVDNTFSSDSREVEKELKKILSEGVASPMCKNFLADMDIDRYLNLWNNGEDNALTADGPFDTQKQDDVMFAKNILSEIVKCMKIDSKDIKEHISRLLNQRSTFGDSPLHAALRHDQLDVAQYLLLLISNHKDCKILVNCQNNSGKTPLHYAVLQNQPEITKTLLLLGVDPNQKDEHGCSALHAAARIPEAGACVGVLLSEKLVDIESHNDAGWTPLHLAAEAGSYEAMCFMVRAGANVNITDMSYGRTALHIAVEEGHKHIVEYLLQKTNVCVNKRNFGGNTALHAAVVHSGTKARELCTLLLKYGADPHIQNRDRESSTDDKGTKLPSNIKKEVESEDEDAVNVLGQSSFDLATTRPDILQLLNDQYVASMTQTMDTSKLEPEDEDAQTTNWLSNKQKEKLAALLDKTEGWKKIIERLKIDYLLKILQHNSSSPSLLLLNYLDVHDTMMLGDMQEMLIAIGETAAAEYISNLLS